MTAKIQKNKFLPDLTLNMNEKIYLAVSKNTNGKTAFVYTLACLRTAPNQYDLYATPEIHAFKDIDSAHIYYETIEKIVEINTQDEKKTTIFEANEEIIQHFQGNVR